MRRAAWAGQSDCFDDDDDAGGIKSFAVVVFWASWGLSWLGGVLNNTPRTIRRSSSVDYLVMDDEIRARMAPGLVWPCASMVHQRNDLSRLWDQILIDRGMIVSQPAEPNAERVNNLFY